MTILSSSPSLCSLQLFRLSSPESSIDAAFLGNRTKPSQYFHLRVRMEVVSSISTSLSCISVGEDFPVDYEEQLPVPEPESRRRTGVLVHPTSFRGPHGIGDLGEEAFRFIDWLHSTGCSVWQVLPLVPPDEGGSPYAGQDANCGNTLLISLDELVKDGLLMKDELPQPIDAVCVNYQTANKLRVP